jgi:hypothetical protein
MAATPLPTSIQNTRSRDEINEKSTPRVAQGPKSQSPLLDASEDSKKGTN